jgi:carbonic anhydrase
MDARLNVYAILGLNDGEAHVIRNAGGVITDDQIRSLAISQQLLGTREIILIHHTDCGMLTFTDAQFKRAIQDETGIKPSWSVEAFPDLIGLGFQERDLLSGEAHTDRLDCTRGPRFLSQRGKFLATRGRDLVQVQKALEVSRLHTRLA